MVKDHSDEIRKLIKKYKKEDIKYAKPLDYLLHKVYQKGYYFLK